ARCADDGDGALDRRHLGHRRGPARRAVSLSRGQGGGRRALRAHLLSDAARARARQRLGGGAAGVDESRVPDAPPAEVRPHAVGPRRIVMRWLVVAVVLCCAMGSAHADTTAEARAEFEAGYDLQPLPLFLFNAAQAARRAGERARALELYKRFVAADPESSQ